MQNWDLEEEWGKGRDEFTVRIYFKECLCSRMIIFGCFLRERSSWIKMKVKTARGSGEAVGSGMGGMESFIYFNYKQGSWFM